MWCTSAALGASALVERDDRRLGVDLDSDPFSEILGLSGRVGNHRSDRLAYIGHALSGEDRLRNRDIIGAIKPRTDRFDTAEAGGGYNGHLLRCVHRQNAASRDRASHKAQDAGTPRLISGVAAAPLQQNGVFIARQRPPNPPHFEDAWSKIPARSKYSRVHAKQPSRQIKRRTRGDRVRVRQ